jgi:hypothetical protein
MQVLLNEKETKLYEEACATFTAIDRKEVLISLILKGRITLDAPASAAVLGVFDQANNRA